DFSPYIFRTHDYGQTWTKIVTGIASTDFVSSVCEDPVRRGLLYAGTEHGFYISLDDGDHWRKLSNGLPITQVSDIWVDGNDIAISTMGRSFYVLDDVNPLRQFGANVMSATDAYLFKPGDAIRTAGRGRIAYWLKKPAQSLKLEIVDSKGEVVRSIEGGTPGRGGRGGRAGEAGGAEAAGRAGTEAGQAGRAGEAGRRGEEQP